METKVKISQGEIVLAKPKAKARNDALIKAEQMSNGGEPSKTVFITELLPHCIKSHPFGAVKVRQALDSLEIEDYDKLAKATGELVKPKEDIEKK